MAKIGSGKSAGWLAITVLSHLLSVNAQPGFLSVDCGGKTDYTDENKIAWVPDANYIDVGQTANTGNTEFPSYLQSLRFFPKPLNKSCYQLQVEPQLPYLLRLWFILGTKTGIPQLSENFDFSIETPGLVATKHLVINHTTSMPSERIFVSAGSVLYICLIRTSDIYDPFINAIELRTLRNGMYSPAKPGRMLRLQVRYYVGGNSLVIRYPQDNFDRIWVSGHKGFSMRGSSLRTVSIPAPISTNSTQDLPPAIVLQNAWESLDPIIPFEVRHGEGNGSLMLLYFAETKEHNMTEGKRSFDVYVNGQGNLPGPITLVQNYSAVEVQLLINVTNYAMLIEKTSDSIYSPILNAFEKYDFIDTDMATSREDVEVLEGIKRRFNIKSWISDPCYLIVWNGIGCQKNTSVRISEINLSQMNLTGPIPQSIGQLTALVNVSLHNNQLIGPLPNFSNLVMLERLHLQNNHLSGSLPEWLSELKNLKELFIDNNKFNGVIPVQLLQNPSLKLSYSGNHGLFIRTHREEEKAGVVVGTSLSGAIIMVLMFVGCNIAVRRKKLREKKSLSKDHSMTVAPNPTMFRAFGLKEITKATQNFSQKIGQGGFGSVFFGRLPGGKEIAVKVLSLLSKQGIHEFRNEVDLLSRVHHNNLVSLLGYCKESKELMLIYEYMSGGSLRDHLYGPKAGISELNWKTRLKIALDAAHGLEYLHVGCNPKIIHRDVKSANILLDSNLKGKVADFGLSRISSDEEATHVTTTVKGTAGYLDPEYFRTQMLTERSDVYSFGVVLFEVICGRAPINQNLPEEELNLIQWVKPYVENESAEEITQVIDRRLGGNYDMKSIIGIAKLALRCVDSKPSSRPTVNEVVAGIKKAILHGNENNAPLPNLEVIGIECGDLQHKPSCSQVDAMEWGDNSSNLPNEGR